MMVIGFPPHSWEFRFLSIPEGLVSGADDWYRLPGGMEWAVMGEVKQWNSCGC